MSPESITSIVVIGAILLVAVAAGLAARNRGQRAGVPPRPYVADITTFPLSAEAQDMVRAELAAERKINAIKKLREQTGLGLADAKQLVEAMASGHQPPTPGESPDDGTGGEVGSGATTRGSLTDRVRALRAEAREMDAIRLLCDEAGMSIPEAQKFLGSLD